jgi:hypothetical protein
MSPKVIDAKIIQVDKHQYSIIRSFYESSLKEDYPWNTGVRLPISHTVIFRKPNKWVLSVNHSVAILSSDKVHGIGFPVGIWNIISYTHYPQKRIFINTKGSQYVEVDDIYTTYVDNPCGYPISVYDLLEKLHKYIDAVRSAIPMNELECNKYCYTKPTDC